MGVLADRRPACCWRRWCAQPWHLYATLGVLVGGGSICLGYTGQSLFLPNWFVRRRGLAMSIAFSGVGVGSIILLPWLQAMIVRAGWRAACWAMAAARAAGRCWPAQPAAARAGPRTSGSSPTASRAAGAAGAGPAAANVVDPAWAAIDWTLARAMRTARFWWIALGYLLRPLRLVRRAGAPDEVPDRDRLHARRSAAWALGFVSLAGIPGQIALGHLSDRIGREWVWTVGSLGFAICYAGAAAPARSTRRRRCSTSWSSRRACSATGSPRSSAPSRPRSSRAGTTASIFGTLMLASIGGGAARPLGDRRAARRHRQLRPRLLARHRRRRLSAVAIWLAAPRKVRAVAGRHRPVAARAPATRSSSPPLTLPSPQRGEGNCHQL